MSKMLQVFRERLQELMTEPGLRPFVCSGSPLDCSVMIVGFNPATSLKKPFWGYWSDATGFDKKSFMRDYLEERRLTAPKAVRARIERIVAQLPDGACIETNICSKPTKTARELALGERTTEIFRYLLGEVKPRLVYAHSKAPIDFFIRHTGCSDFDQEEPREVQLDGHKFLLIGTRRPLFLMSLSDASSMGRRIANWLQLPQKPVVTSRSLSE